MQERSDSEGKRVSVHEKAGSAESDTGTAMRTDTKFNNNNTSGGPAGVVAPLSKEMIKTSAPLHNTIMSNRVKGHPHHQAIISAKLELSLVFLEYSHFLSVFGTQPKPEATLLFLFLFNCADGHKATTKFTGAATAGLQQWKQLKETPGTDHLWFRYQSFTHWRFPTEPSVGRAGGGGD